MDYTKVGPWGCSDISAALPSFGQSIAQLLLSFLFHLHPVCVLITLHWHLRLWGSAKHPRKTQRQLQETEHECRNTLLKVGVEATRWTLSDTDVHNQYRKCSEKWFYWLHPYFEELQQIYEFHLRQQEKFILKATMTRTEKSDRLLNYGVKVEEITKEAHRQWLMNYCFCRWSHFL